MLSVRSLFYKNQFIKGSCFLYAFLIFNIATYTQDLGNIPILVNIESSSIEQGKPMWQVKDNQAIMGSVGGVSFDQIAIPDDNLNISSLTLNYSESNEDGSRMQLQINGNNIKSPIYDWMLVPIANFANSPYYACFTFFGELKDKNLENIILNNGGNVLNYHPKLKNTLLGWRIAEIDLLVMYEFTSSLPKQEGDFILGAGENQPDTIANQVGWNNFLIHINNVTNQLQQVFRSYVITDYLQDVNFSIDENQLEINGAPFYYCWRYNFDSPDFNELKVKNNIIESYEKVITQQKNIDPHFNERDLYIDSLLSAAEIYEDKYNFYASGTFVDLINIDNIDESRENFLEQYYTSSLYDMLIDVELRMIAYSIDYLQEYSESISQPQMIKSANPAVWHATKTLMNYAAFFRYIKKEFPNEWSNFIMQIQQVNIAPFVLTPSVMCVTDNQKIKDALDIYFEQNKPKVKVESYIDLGACNKDYVLSAEGSGIDIAWKWKPDDGSLSDVNIENPILVKPHLGDSTEYIVTIKDIYGNEASDSVIIAVKDMPFVNAIDDIYIDQNEIPITLETETKGAELQITWSPDDNSLDSINVQNPQIVNPNLNISTSYIIEVTDKYNCSASDTVNVFISNATTSQNPYLSEIVIYPNPFSNRLFIRNSEKISMVKLIAPSGNVVVEKKCTGDDIIIETHKLEKGLYLLYLYTSNKKVFINRVLKI